MINHAVPRIAFFKAFVILLATATMMSCSKDDDDDKPNIPAPQDVSFRIQLEKIVALSIASAEGDHLEVYGTVNSKLKRGNITEENMIWSLGENEWIAVGTSDVPLSQTFTYAVPEANVETSVLEIIVSFTDKDPDGNPDEFLGTRSLSIPLPNITATTEYNMVFDDVSDHVVRLTYRITKE
jgi:hypothetical protein